MVIRQGTSYQRSTIGFGFAGALREIGLPANALRTALAAFNVGVEIGQVAIV
jgi:hypothetical protein